MIQRLTRQHYFNKVSKQRRKFLLLYVTDSEEVCGVCNSSEMVSKRVASCHGIIERGITLTQEAINRIRTLRHVLTYQDLAAVTKPATSVFSGQDEGKGLAVNETGKQEDEARFKN